MFTHVHSKGIFHHIPSLPGQRSEPVRGHRSFRSSGVLRFSSRGPFEQECATFGPTLRRRCAELRAAAAQRRLELLKKGDMKDGAT